MKKKGGKAVQTTANLLLITKIYSLGGGKMKTFGTMGQFLIPDGTVNKFSQESARKGLTSLKYNSRKTCSKIIMLVLYGRF